MMRFAVETKSYKRLMISIACHLLPSRKKADVSNYLSFADTISYVHKLFKEAIE